MSEEQGGMRVYQASGEIHSRSIGCLPRGAYICASDINELPGDESVKLFWIGLRRLVQKKLSDKCHISSRGHNAVQCSHLASQNCARARDDSTARERVMKCERGGRVVFG